MAVLFSKRPCITLGNKLNDCSLRYWVARFALIGVALLCADIGWPTPARVNIDIELSVTRIYGTFPAIASKVLQPQLRRGAMLLSARGSDGMHCIVGGCLFFGCQ